MHTLLSIYLVGLTIAIIVVGYFEIYSRHHTDRMPWYWAILLVLGWPLIPVGVVVLGIILIFGTDWSH